MTSRCSRSSQPNSAATIKCNGSTREVYDKPLWMQFSDNTVTQAHTEAVVEPHAMTDDRWREAITLVERRSGRRLRHGASEQTAYVLTMPLRTLRQRKLLIHLEASVRVPVIDAQRRRAAPKDTPGRLSGGHHRPACRP
jgi:hypothetical protein